MPEIVDPPAETEPAVAIHIVETIDYNRTVSIAELERISGVTLEECEGSVDMLVEAAQNTSETDFHERLEKYGDVRSQDWYCTETTMPAGWGGWN